MIFPKELDDDLSNERPTPRRRRARRATRSVATPLPRASSDAGDLWDAPPPVANDKGGVRGRLTTVADIMRYAPAGSATFTLVSERTGVRFTYKVVQVEEGEGTRKGPVSHWVRLLNGADNESSYVYLGQLREEWSGRRYQQGRKSRIAEDAPSARAFAWFWQKISEDTMPPNLQVWHEGACSKCGHKLTVPASIACGMGPVCRGDR